MSIETADIDESLLNCRWSSDLDVRTTKDEDGTGAGNTILGVGEVPADDGLCECRSASIGLVGTELCLWWLLWL